MAFKHDPRFDAPDVTERELTFRPSPRTFQLYHPLIVLLRLLYGPAVVVALLNLPTPPQFLQLTALMLASYGPYLLIVEQRLNRYCVRRDAGTRTESLTPALSRRHFFHSAMHNPEYLTAQLPESSPVSVAYSHNVMCILLYLWLLLIPAYVERAYPPDGSSWRLAFLTLCFLTALSASIYVYRRQLRANKYRIEDGWVVNAKSGYQIVRLENTESISMHWDAFAYCDYARFQHAGMSYRVYNLSEDPLSLLRLLRAQIPQTHAGPDFTKLPRETYD